MGFLLASILTDTLGYLISRPTPSLYSDCRVSCLNGSWINVTTMCDEKLVNGTSYRQYLRSFPNYRSTVSAYAATYMSW